MVNMFKCILIMNRFSINISLILCVVASIAFMGCEEEGGKYKDYVYPKPIVDEVFPENGYAGSRITILGENFGDRVEPVRVYFGGSKAETVLSCKDNCIVVEVPEDALTGDVSLELWTHSLDNIATFTVLPLPEFSSIVSENELGGKIAVPGDIVTIQGKGFGDDTQVVSVEVNGGKKAEVIAVSDTEIKFKVPEGFQTGNVIVVMHGRSFEAGSLLNPNMLGDITFAYMKNYKQPFVADPEMTEGMKGSDNNWRLPYGWILNDAAKNQKNKGATEFVGGLHFGEDAVNGHMILQSGWSTSAAFTNGKMYQVVQSLPAGKYKLTIYMKGWQMRSGSVLYFTVSKGNELPDVGYMPQAALNAFQFAGSVVLDPSIEFEIEEQSDVCIGFVGSLNPDSYFRVNELKLELLELSH